MDIKTLDKLPDEDKIETVTRVKTRRRCEICGDDAHFKQTFLLPNARSNPASSGYGRDDISWCSDAHIYTCAEPECKRKGRQLDGYRECSTFPANKRFAHMFLYWKEQ